MWRPCRRLAERGPGRVGGDEGLASSARSARHLEYRRRPRDRRQRAGRPACHGRSMRQAIVTAMTRRPEHYRGGVGWGVTWRRGEPPVGARRPGRRLLPGPLPGSRRLRRARLDRRLAPLEMLSRCRRLADRVPGRLGWTPSRLTCESARGRADLVGYRADDRPAGRHRHRRREHQLGDPAPARRAAPGHDHAALGPDQDPADRPRRRPDRPGGSPRATRHHRRGLRHRRT